MLQRRRFFCLGYFYWCDSLSMCLCMCAQPWSSVYLCACVHISPLVYVHMYCNKSHHTFFFCSFYLLRDAFFPRYWLRLKETFDEKHKWCSGMPLYLSNEWREVGVEMHRIVDHSNFLRFLSFPTHSELSVLSEGKLSRLSHPKSKGKLFFACDWKDIFLIADPSYLNPRNCFCTN